MSLMPMSVQSSWMTRWHMRPCPTANQPTHSYDSSCSTWECVNLTSNLWLILMSYQIATIWIDICRDFPRKWRARHEGLVRASETVYIIVVHYERLIDKVCFFWRASIPVTVSQCASQGFVGHVPSGPCGHYAPVHTNIIYNSSRSLFKTLSELNL